MSGTKGILAFAAAVAFCAGRVAAAEGGLPAEAVEAIQAGNWPAVVKLLKDDGEAANFWRGAAWYAQGQTGKASEYLARAVRADPHSRTTALLLARCAADSGHHPFTRLPKYVAELEKAWPGDADVLHCIGCGWMNNYLFKLRHSVDMYARDRNVSLGRAVDYFRRADAVGTAMPDNDRWLAFLLYRDGSNEQALAHARRAARRGAVGYEVYLIMAGALTRLGRDAEAELAFAEARRLAPGKAGVVAYERGKALCGEGRYNEAVEAFRKVLAGSWSMPNIRHWIGGAAFGGKDYRLGLWGFIESHKVDGRLDSVYYAGRCAYALQRYALAEERFQQAVKDYLAKAASRGAKDVKGPTEWTHYLGRAQWAQGKYAEAIKNLESAFAGRTGSALYARWLYRAHLARDDVHAAIDVCRRLGRNSARRDDAIEGVLGIMDKWPRPRMQDFLARKKPHLVVAWEALADLYERKGRYFTAAHYHAKARRTRGRFVSVKAAWALAHSRQWPEAEAAFRDAVRYYTEKDFGRWGLGCVLTAGGKWAEAAETFAQITRPSMLAGCDAGRLWAGLAAKDPAAGKLADPYTLLGLMESRRLGEGRGEDILFIIPGSVLAATSPQLRVDDVLLSVGEMPLGTVEQLGAFRKSKIPAGPVPALVRRGRRTFEVTLDYPSAVRKLPPPAGGAATKEAGP